MLPFEVSIAILKHIADKCLVLFNNSGHWPPFEKPPEWAAQVLAFVKGYCWAGPLASSSYKILLSSSRRRPGPTCPPFLISSGGKVMPAITHRWLGDMDPGLPPG